MLFVFTVGVIRYRDASAYNVESLGDQYRRLKYLNRISSKLGLLLVM
jgi:hypothetical protein